MPPQRKQAHHKSLQQHKLRVYYRILRYITSSILSRQMRTVRCFGRTIMSDAVIPANLMLHFCPQYQKPSLILEQEKLVRQELVKMKSSRDGDVECKPS